MTLSQGYSYFTLYFNQTEQISLLILGCDVSSMNLLQCSKIIFLGKKRKKKITPNPKLFPVVTKELPKVLYNLLPAVIFLSLDDISHRGIKAYGTSAGGLVIPNQVSP